MKNLLTTIILIFTSLIFHGQSMSKINYQAVVRDANGNILPNTAVPVTITISNCTVYDGNPTTNDYGLINLELDLSNCSPAIDWSQGNLSVNSSINNISGSSNLNSVPYSLHATTVANYPSAGNSDGDILVWSASSGEWVAQSSSSTNGINCWDTNGDGVNDSSEDTNNDGTWNALDCAGADGADGQDGAQASVGAVIYIYNGQTCPAGWNTQQINVAIFGGAAVDACYTDSPCVVMYIYDGQTCPAGWTTWPIGVSVLNGTNIPVDACFKCN